MAQMPMSSRRSSRYGTKCVWIVLHTSEGTSHGARGLRDATWWEGSSHAISDDKELLDHRSGCVDPAYGAWTLRNGNPCSVNIEQVAYAKWSRSDWLDNHMPMLRFTAQWIADMAQRFDIPITYIGTQGVRDKRAGVIQHNDYTQGAGDGSHWDCGPGYPIDVVIDLARDYANPKPAPTPASAPAPTSTSTTRRSSDMFLFRRNKPRSGVRLFTSAAKPMLYDFSDENAAEIAKALKDPTYIAEVGPQGYDELAKALGK